ncbi:TetR/AcrR family transcriptional regulator [Ktedonosporobacter rubrisoli]|uniref:TetR/AcrR family transcriptional regulator n=2 Tax=Ktedonosporobacter rubrisoli TaxID=2509675 RepID=A0A4P6K6N0_KTERU|nr:TetR/AcrR family transcriptional regulator [Ktedonosporobacter rubrisoli]
MSEQRRQRLRMEISREAARLFWLQGIEATTGEQIADAVGLSVRTIWRYFRNKESCAEPVLMYSVEWFLSVLRSWPLECSFEEHYATELTKLAKRYREPDEEADDLAASKMIVLANTEPALRTTWLMACDQVEREFAVIIARRLQRATDDVEVRMHAAAATAVVRVFSEALNAAYLSGTDLATIGDPREHLARAVRQATGGAIGDPVVS